LGDRIGPKNGLLYQAAALLTMLWQVGTWPVVNGVGFSPVAVVPH
jgi:hypothetical protein